MSVGLHLITQSEVNWCPKWATPISATHVLLLFSERGEAKAAGHPAAERTA